jgi:hypothetical protein
VRRGERESFEDLTRRDGYSYIGKWKVDVPHGSGEKFIVYMFIMYFSYFLLLYFVSQWLPSINK